MTELLTELLSLTKAMESLERRGQEIRNAFRKRAPGRHGAFIVYEVGECRVRAHTRKAYRAVRLVRKKEAK